jgi:predicted DCC family thiol-disulfide oxidoreductase YuxK
VAGKDARARFASPTDNGGMNGTLFFDGECGMCTRARNFLVKLDRRGHVQTEPFQRPGSAERLGIPAPRLPESVWWLDASGEVYAGAKACNAALSAALDTHLPMLLYRIPIVRPLQEAVYRWVAAHRHRFPGTTPYCESNPGGC